MQFFDVKIRRNANLAEGYPALVNLGRLTGTCMLLYNIHSTKN